jgi:hypothetical protein
MATRHEKAKSSFECEREGDWMSTEEDECANHNGQGSEFERANNGIDERGGDGVRERERGELKGKGLSSELVVKKCG